LIDPILEYQNANVPGGLGRSVIGGHIYRGDALPAFQGRYIFGDWSTGGAVADGVLLVATPPEAEGETWPFQELSVSTSENGRLNSYLLSFGQDADLEVYVLVSTSLGPSGDTGKVYKIVP
jgi:hypothetical protein